MKTGPLLDNSGSYIGQITQSGEKYCLFDSTGSLLGIYDPDRDATFDAGGTYIGKGNILTILLRP